MMFHQDPFPFCVRVAFRVTLDIVLCNGLHTIHVFVVLDGLVFGGLNHPSISLVLDCHKSAGH